MLPFLYLSVLIPCGISMFFCIVPNGGLFSVLLVVMFPLQYYFYL